MVNIGISFDNSQNIFYNGQHVSGFVSVAVINSTPVRGKKILQTVAAMLTKLFSIAITLWVSGVAEVRWEEMVHQARQHRQHATHHHPHSRTHHHHHHNRAELKIFSSQELYFEHKIILLPAACNYEINCADEKSKSLVFSNGPCPPARTIQLSVQF